MTPSPPPPPPYPVCVWGQKWEETLTGRCSSASIVIPLSLSSQPAMHILTFSLLCCHRKLSFCNFCQKSVINSMIHKSESDYDLKSIFMTGSGLEKIPTQFLPQPAIFDCSSESECSGVRTPTVTGDSVWVISVTTQEAEFLENGPSLLLTPYLWIFWPHHLAPGSHHRADDCTLCSLKADKP